MPGAVLRLAALARFLLFRAPSCAPTADFVCALLHCLSPSQMVADALWLTTTEYEEESESHTKLAELAKEMLTEGVVPALPVSHAAF